MVYGADDPKLMDAFNRLLGSDVVYGATQGYLASLQRYLEGDEAARIDNGAQEFLDRLQAQRRRLFFTIPDTEREYNHWHMTAFRFAGDYLEMIDLLADGKGVSERSLFLNSSTALTEQIQFPPHRSALSLDLAVVPQLPD